MIRNKVYIENLVLVQVQCAECGCVADYQTVIRDTTTMDELSESVAVDEAAVWCHLKEGLGWKVCGDELLCPGCC